MGVEGVGQALLHVLAVVQVGAGAVLLNVPFPIMAALMALTFHAWSGAAEMLSGRASGRSVGVEFGSLLVFGLLVGMILHRV